MTDFDPLDTFRSAVLTPDRQRSERIRDEFRARIATMATDEDGRRPFDPPTPTRTKQSPRQPLLALVAMVAVLALATGGALWLEDDRTPALSVDELAIVAATQPGRTLDAGDYLYRAERSSDGNQPATLESQWTAVDGTGQRVVTALQIGRPGEHPPSLTLYTEPGSLQFARLSYDELWSLPTNPTALIARLRQLGATDGPLAVDDARALADVLALAVTPPEVASAAVQALAQLGGTAIGPAQDGAGRTGIGVRGINDDGTTWLVVLDPVSGRALGFQPHWSGEPGVGPSRSWIDQQITDSLPR